LSSRPSGGPYLEWTIAFIGCSCRRGVGGEDLSWSTRPSRWEVLVHDSLEGTGALPSNRILSSMRSTAHAAVNRLLRRLKPKFLDELAGSGALDEE
jgi:hypothetical protein